MKFSWNQNVYMWNSNVKFHETFQLLKIDLFAAISVMDLKIDWKEFLELDETHLMVYLSILWIAYQVAVQITHYTC